MRLNPETLLQIGRLLASGGTVVASRKLATPDRIPPAALPGGTVVAAGFIPGRPQPWKAFTVGKQPADYLRFKAWKETVRALAAGTRRIAGIYEGPVRVEATFLLNPPSGRQQTPDVGNMMKAFVDGLQGAVIANDREVWGEASRRVVSAFVAEGVRFRVVADSAPMFDA